MFSELFLPLGISCQKKQEKNCFWISFGIKCANLHTWGTLNSFLRRSN